MKYPLVSLITVNYHRADVTIELLQSLQKYPYPNLEVIVVDNDSKEDISEQLKEILPEVKVIPTYSNLGFAGGNNIGINASKGEYIFLINNDAEVISLSIEKLVARASSDKKIGCVSPKIKYFYQPEIIQYAGFTKINAITGRNKTIGGKQKDSNAYNKAQVTAYAHGAAMLIKREVIEKVGNMPEDYFLYYEELDWSQKIINAGYDIYFEPASIVYHKESVSTGKNSKLQEFYKTRNRMLFMYRNQKRLHFIAFTAYFLFTILIKKLFTKELSSIGNNARGVTSALGIIFQKNIMLNRHN